MIHILLPVHNRAQVTEALAAALAQQDIGDYRLLLIDDGCRDDTVARVQAVLPASRLQVLTGDGNLWWAGALQLGHDALLSEPVDDDDAVLILNDDVEFEPDFLRTGLAVLRAYPDAAMQAVGHDRVTGTVDRGAVADLIALSFEAATPQRPANCLATRGLLMRAATFKRSGGFRPRWLPHYLSDYEFTLRLRAQGTPLLCDDRFRAVVRLELTGLESYRTDGWSAFWNEAFSNRAKHNPLHWSAFVVMACPWWTWPLHLPRVWLGFARAALRVALRPARA